MTTFTLIITILFVSALAYQFISAIDKNLFSLAALFGFEIVAFAYLANTLM